MTAMQHDERFGDWYTGRLLTEFAQETYAQRVLRYAMLGLLDGPHDPDEDEEEDDDAACYAE